MIDRKKIGKRNRINGAIFEKLVRKDLESEGWIVSRWQNNVEFFEEENQIPDEDGKCVYAKLIPAKASRFRLSSTGFPDFICLMELEKDYNVIGVEVKTNGILSKEEKEKCAWLIENNIFSKILIASKYKEKNRVKIKYTEFK